jgi:hypothetical protein
MSVPLVSALIVGFHTRNPLAAIIFSKRRGRAAD